MITLNFQCYNRGLLLHEKINIYIEIISSMFQEEKIIYLRKISHSILEMVFEDPNILKIIDTSNFLLVSSNILVNIKLKIK